MRCAVRRVLGVAFFACSGGTVIPSPCAFSQDEVADNTRNSTRNTACGARGAPGSLAVVARQAPGHRNRCLLRANTLSATGVHMPDTCSQDIAYNAMNGRFRPSNTTRLSKAEAHAFSVAGPPNQQLAMQLVHSTEYHAWKCKIMRPIDEFAAQASTRLINKVPALAKALCCGHAPCVANAPLSFDVVWFVLPLSFSGHQPAFRSSKWTPNVRGNLCRYVAMAVVRRRPARLVSLFSGTELQCPTHHFFCCFSGFSSPVLWIQRQKVLYNISWGHSSCAKAVGCGTFPGICEFLVQCAKFPFRWGGGGVCVYFLKSVRKGRFRNVWVRGGG